MSKKRLFLLFVLLLSISISSFAQAQIEGFWGVKLGDTERSVVSKVKQSYPSANYVKYSSGYKFKVFNVSLAGLDVDNCEFDFTSGILKKATFNKIVGWKQIHVSRVQSFLNSLTQQMQSDYQEVCDAISSKYGIVKPHFD